jgi:hypothetical protein
MWLMVQKSLPRNVALVSQIALCRTVAGEDGSFLVRPSSQLQNSLSLTLCYRRRLYNIGIRHRPDGRYALGTEKENEQVHSSEFHWSAGSVTCSGNALLLQILKVHHHNFF